MIDIRTVWLSHQMADLYQNRPGYMERKSSGFGKMINGYESQVNYNMIAC